MEKSIQEIVTILFSVGVIVIFFTGLFYFMDIMYEENEQDDREVLEPQCKQRCQSFGGMYYDLIKDGWQYRCWCLQEDFKGTFLAGELTSPRVK